MSKKNEKGFTLIELLVVVAIIGILAAIAIPQFAQYRASAFCSQVESDVANAMITMEGEYARVDPPVYPTLPDLALFTPTAGVVVTSDGTVPVTVVGTRGDANVCPKGGTFTMVQGAGTSWAP